MTGVQLIVLYFRGNTQSSNANTTLFTDMYWALLAHLVSPHFSSFLLILLICERRELYHCKEHNPPLETSAVSL